MHIKDNGAYDSNNTLGVVSDPGGIAIVTLQPPLGGGGGGGAPIVVQPSRTTVDTRIEINVANIQIEKDIVIQGVITDKDGNKLDINGLALITIEGKGRLIKQVEIKNGEYTLAIKPSELAKSVKSREVSISISFNGLELRQGNRIVEYKASDAKIDAKIIGNIIDEKVREGKRAIMVLLENITDSKITKITLHAEDGGKIIAVNAKDFNRKRISMQEVELNIKEGKVKSFGDIIKFVVVKEGKVT